MPSIKNDRYYFLNKAHSGVAMLEENRGTHANDSFFIRTFGFCFGEALK